MPPPEASMSWVGALAWFGAIAMTSFLVSWVITDVLHIGRTWYVAALTAITAGLMFGYLAWSGTDPVIFLRTHWGWGILARSYLAA